MTKPANPYDGILLGIKMLERTRIWRRKSDREPCRVKSRRGVYVLLESADKQLSDMHVEDFFRDYESVELVN